MLEPDSPEFLNDPSAGELKRQTYQELMNLIEGKLTDLPFAIKLGEPNTDVAYDARTFLINAPQKKATEGEVSTGFIFVTEDGPFNVICTRLPDFPNSPTDVELDINKLLEGSIPHNGSRYERWNGKIRVGTDGDIKDIPLDKEHATVTLKVEPFDGSLVDVFNEARNRLETQNSDSGSSTKAILQAKEAQNLLHDW